MANDTTTTIDKVALKAALETYSKLDEELAAKMAEVEALTSAKSECVETMFNLGASKVRWQNTDLTIVRRQSKKDESKAPSFFLKGKSVSASLDLDDA